MVNWMSITEVQAFTKTLALFAHNDYSQVDNLSEMWPSGIVGFTNSESEVFLQPNLLNV